MPLLPQRSLVWKYAAYFSGLVSALLIVSGGLAGYFAYRQALASVEELQREKARFVAAEIENFIDRVEGALRSTASKFGTGESVDIDDLTVELIALLRHQPSITALRWIDADGREWLAFSRIERDNLDRGRSWLADPGFVATRSRTAFAGPVLFRSETEPYISLATAREPGGPVLVAEVNLKFVSDVIATARGRLPTVAYVVDREGRLVSHTDLGLVLGRADLSALPQVRGALMGNGAEVSYAGDARNLDGKAVVATSVPIERLGWTVFAERSRAQALRPVYVSVARSLALVMLGTIAAIAASVLLARRMVRPIRQIEAGAREIGEGKLGQRIRIDSDDELGALGTQFNGMAERLQAIYATQETTIAERTRELALANEAKSRFLAAASHDLRQPMQALSLFVGQLRGRPNAPETPRLLERIEQSVDALEQLLEALLDLSKLDMGAVTAQPQAFALQELIARLASHLAPVAEAKGLALTFVPTSVWVRSDPLLLERILVNVAGNAIRYTSEGRILIGCRRRGDRVDLVIADTGVGIAPEHLPNIFQEFYQVAPQGATKGIGLGLAIVKRLATLLDHELAVDSVPGKGTVVRVRVPRAVPHAIEPQAAGEPTRDLGGTRVLVVDDEIDAREAIEGLLEQWGCEVVTAAGSDDALASTRTWRPDVVLCDLTLADGASGLDVVERLRRRHGSGLACAFVTGESAPEVIDTARARGYPMAFKPTRPAKLRALVEHLVHAGEAATVGASGKVRHDSSDGAPAGNA